MLLVRAINTGLVLLVANAVLGPDMVIGIGIAVAGIVVALAVGVVVWSGWTTPRR